DEIRQEIASRLHLIRIQIAENDGGQRGRPRSRPQTVSQSASHSSMGSFTTSTHSSGSLPAAASGRQNSAMNANPEGATVVRSQPKVGRNDPCPCGSGKKYKYCHGR
ncbi:MAG: SEC-C metal-binding domain-containing protein, partial [Treponema sp.]|nr:SEC-C metal-binding domain-containing protein [Treponema sp.]